MSFQNPVFIPGPTNMPEALRRACDMPTLDHRSPLFGQILQPALAGVKKVLKTETAEVFLFPSTGNRRLGNRDHQLLEPWRQDPGCPKRHVQPPLDRHVPAPRPEG